MSHVPSQDYLQSAVRWFGRSGDQLSKAERKALRHASQRLAVSQDPNKLLDERATVGERLADAVARFGGSWTFIIVFFVLLMSWTLVNTQLLGDHAFDPYPFIFLNLVLSMLAAIQAPIIMMSQNRQSTKDRQMATHDYEVNLKAEIEIMALHDKLDALRNEQLTAILVKQQEQITLLTKLLAERHRH
jgi:uncharacterized membrane protein